MYSQGDQSAQKYSVYDSMKQGNFLRLEAGTRVCLAGKLINCWLVNYFFEQVSSFFPCLSSDSGDRGWKGGTDRGASLMQICDFGLI